MRRLCLRCVGLGVFVALAVGVLGCHNAASVRVAKGVQPRPAVVVKSRPQARARWVRRYTWKRTPLRRALARTSPQGLMGGLVVSSGCLSMRPIKRTMRGLHPDFVRCISQSQARLCQMPLAAVSSQGGRYKFRLLFSIGARGQVSRITVEADRPSELRLLQCLSQITASARFPAPPPHTNMIQVSYPVRALLGRPGSRACAP